MQSKVKNSVIPTKTSVFLWKNDGGINELFRMGFWGGATKGCSSASGMKTGIFFNSVFFVLFSFLRAKVIIHHSESWRSFSGFWLIMFCQIVHSGESFQTRVFWGKNQKKGEGSNERLFLCVGDESRGIFSVFGAGTWLLYFGFLLYYLKLFSPNFTNYTSVVRPAANV